jgi:phospho-N-acetylmuramoyl-pentapeptide-transferase
MLLEIFQWLSKDVRVFNVFGYITLRTVLAALTALSISFIVGPWMIRKLTALKIGQSVRNDGPQSHLVKSGTPTMGGALILVSVAVTTLIWGDLQNRYVWACLVTTIGFGVIGWIDDYRKVVHKNSKGLSAKAKFFWQTVIAAVALSYIAYRANLPQQTDLIVPFFKTVAIPLGTIGFIILGWFTVVGFSNAVNLTDGLDGLAIMPTVMVASALAIFAYVAGNKVFAAYLGVPHIAGAGELAIFCGAIAGSGVSLVQRVPGGSLYG